MAKKAQYFVIAQLGPYEQICWFPYDTESAARKEYRRLKKGEGRYIEERAMMCTFVKVGVVKVLAWEKAKKP